MHDDSGRGCLVGAGGLTSFVGRRQEIAGVRRNLSASRLVTLTGPGGIGKTRLALVVADRARRAFRDGIQVVQLASLDDAREVASAFTSALAVLDQSNRSATQQLVDHLGTQQVLLVVDNCEHVLTATAELLAELLETAPGLRVLATSREPLGIAGELVTVIPPLSVPTAEQLHDAASVDHSEAVQLLVDRARSVAPDFAVTDANRLAVQQLCERLDGMPLAIELAAIRLRTLSVGQVVERLDHRFELLTGGSRVARPRQQTLRALIDWSHELCSDDERLLWARMSVFPGGCDLTAVEEVCGFGDFAAERVVDVLDRLVAKSIVIAEHIGERVRYRQLMTVREYGAERLDELGELPVLRRRMRDHYLRQARSMVERWCGPGQHEMLATMRRDHANLLAALEWSLATPDERPAGGRLASFLRYHWIAGGSLSEGRRWLDRILDVLDGDTVERGSVLWVAAWATLLQGDREAAAVRLAELEHVAVVLGDQELAAHAANWRALYHLFSGSLPTAIGLYHRAVQGHRALGSTGAVLTAQFQLAMARNFQEPAGDALETCREVLAVSARHGERWNHAYALWISGLQHWRAGDMAAAKQAATAALEIQRDFTDGVCTALVLELMSWIAMSNQQADNAAMLGAAAGAVWHRLGTSIDAFGPHITADSLRLAQQVVETVGAERVAKVTQRLAHLTKAEAIELALEIDAAVKPTTATCVARSCPLTDRELEVARLIATGLSNRAIAENLVISPRTVDGHVERMLGKLGFASRTQVASWIASLDESGDEARAHRAPAP
ncbi:LuxR C-terminal-related transcriptional regulator [Saccharopolyspora sp. NPDC050642]|uniref:ATP-binding protein n=1 Tax=Saccharopolyspora sp. NPDC050642 TaxID=3157099 RepID=UPI00340D5794